MQDGSRVRDENEKQQRLQREKELDALFRHVMGLSYPVDAYDEPTDRYDYGPFVDASVGRTREFVDLSYYDLLKIRSTFDQPGESAECGPDCRNMQDLRSTFRRSLPSMAGRSGPDDHPK